MAAATVRPSRSLLAALAACLALASPAQAAVGGKEYVVTTTQASGPGSLMQALAEANERDGRLVYLEQAREAQFLVAGPRGPVVRNRQENRRIGWRSGRMYVRGQ